MRKHTTPRPDYRTRRGLVVPPNVRRSLAASASGSTPRQGVSKGAGIPARYRGPDDAADRVVFRGGAERGLTLSAARCMILRRYRPYWFPSLPQGKSE